MNAEQLRYSIQADIAGDRLASILDTLNDNSKYMGIIVSGHFEFSYWKPHYIVQALDYPYIQRALFTQIKESYKVLDCDLLSLFVFSGFNEGVAHILKSPDGSTCLMNMKVDGQKRTFIYIFLELIAELDTGQQYEKYLKPKLENINQVFSVIREYHSEPSEDEKKDISALLQRLSRYIYYDRAEPDTKELIKNLMMSAIRYVPQYDSYHLDIKHLHSGELLKHIVRENNLSWDQQYKLYESYDEENVVYKNTLALGNRRLLIKSLVKRPLLYYCAGAIGKIVEGIAEYGCPLDVSVLITNMIDWSFKEMLLLGTVCKAANQGGKVAMQEYLEGNIQDKEIYEQYCCKFHSISVMDDAKEKKSKGFLSWIFS